MCSRKSKEASVAGVEGTVGDEVKGAKGSVVFRGLIDEGLCANVIFYFE